MSIKVISYNLLLDGNNVKLIWDDNNYSSKFFQVLPENERTIKVSDKNYKGAFRIASQNNKIQIINTLTLEEYIKGVVPMEMPNGKGTENFEVLKAFSSVQEPMQLRSSIQRIIMIFIMM